MKNFLIALWVMMGLTGLTPAASAAPGGGDGIGSGPPLSAIISMLHSYPVGRR